MVYVTTDEFVDASKSKVKHDLGDNVFMSNSSCEIMAVVTLRLLSYWSSAKTIWNPLWEKPDHKCRDKWNRNLSNRSVRSNQIANSMPENQSKHADFFSRWSMDWITKGIE